MERTISFMNGEGSIGHNTRRFIADNVDASRTPNNITLKGNEVAGRLLQYMKLLNIKTTDDIDDDNAGTDRII